MENLEDSKNSSTLFSPWNLYKPPEAAAHIPALGLKREDSQKPPSQSRREILWRRGTRGSHQIQPGGHGWFHTACHWLLLIQTLTKNECPGQAYADCPPYAWHMFTLSFPSGQLFPQSLTHPCITLLTWHTCSGHIQSRASGVKAEGRRGKKILVTLLFTFPCPLVWIMPPTS